MQPDKPDQSEPAPRVIVPEVLPPQPPVIAGAPTPSAGGQSGFARYRLRLAFAIAIVSDLISFGTSLAEPIQLGVDLTTAALLFVVLGWRWALLVGLVMEAIPLVSMFPAWVMVVGTIAVWGTARPKLN